MNIGFCDRDYPFVWLHLSKVNLGQMQSESLRMHEHIVNIQVSLGLSGGAPVTFLTVLPGALQEGAIYWRMMVGACA